MPDTAQTVPLFGVGTGIKSPNLSAQLRTNLYVEMQQDADKSAIAYFSRPGLLRFGQLAEGAARGALTTAPYTTSSTDIAIFVAGTSVVFMRADGSELLGLPNAVGTTVGPVRSAQFGQQGVYIDGVSGYAFSYDVNSIGASLLASPFPANCPSVTACASRIVAVDPAAVGRFRWSAAGDATSWNSLDFATKESAPDPLAAVFEAHGQLLLFGTQTTEFWAPAAAGASGQLPFVRVGAANIQWGTSAIDTIRKAGESVIFLGHNPGGNRQVIKLDGYTATVISTPEIDAAIASDPVPDAAQALYAVVGGHGFYILNLSNVSWVLDVTTGTWGRWMTDGGRFAGQLTLPAFGKCLVTDYRDGRVYTLDTATYTDDGNVMVREAVSKHASANLARLSLHELRLDAETGVGLASGGDPQVMLQWSKDGGHTWGNEVWQSLGPIGSYLTHAVWRMLGRSRDWVFRLRVTDPVKVVIIGAAALFTP